MAREDFENGAKLAFVEQALQERTQTHQLRSLRAVESLDSVTIRRDGKTLINFSSNDYLGLSQHPQLIAAALDYTNRYGVGATASRLVVGTSDRHLELEQKLAQACGYEAALIFSSGFQTNSTVIPALVDRQSLIVCDRLCHNSLLQGAIASRAQLIRYRHNDLNHLSQLLQQARQKSYNRILIVSETVFSMDGDRTDVAAISALAAQHGAILYLDDAHALGVMGRNGMGLAAHQPGIDVMVGTFGKAFGSFGAFIACSQQLRDYLINCCAGFIYTTALPPGVIGAIATALDLIPTLEEERSQLTETGNYLRQQLAASGWQTGASHSQIVPILLGDAEKTLSLSRWLEEQGILAIAIRPPTVPASTARIRLTLSSQHTPAQVEQLIAAVRAWHV